MMGSIHQRLGLYSLFCLLHLLPITEDEVDEEPWWKKGLDSPGDFIEHSLRASYAGSGLSFQPLFALSRTQQCLGHPSSDEAYTYLSHGVGEWELEHMDHSMVMPWVEEF